MAIVTGICRIKMAGVFTGRRCAIVTAGTRSRHAAMVKHHRRPTASYVAVITRIGAGDMSW